MSVKIDVPALDDFIAREGLTFEELAKNTGIARSTIYHLRKNPETFTSKQINTLAKALRCGAEDLIEIRAGE